MNWPPPFELVCTSGTAFVLGVAIGYTLAHSEKSQKGIAMKPLEKIRTWFDRWFTVMFLLVAAAALLGIYVGVSATITNGRQDTAAAAANKAAQVQACENTNEARKAQLLLWNYIIDTSVQRPDDDGTPKTPEELAQIEKIREWITLLFEPRDCSDLTREYPLPDPPEIFDH